MTGLRHPKWCDLGRCTAATVGGFHLSEPIRVEIPDLLGYPLVEVYERLSTHDEVTDQPSIWLRLTRTDYESVEGYELSAGQCYELAAALREVADDHTSERR